MDGQLRLSMLTSYHGNEADLDPALQARLYPAPIAPRSANTAHIAADGRTLVVAQGATATAHSLSFFPPIVDDPFVYGEIAAAQAMAGIYALGGEVTFGLSIASWPEDLAEDLLGAIVAGAAAQLAAGGAQLVGGQAIIATSPSFGLNVIGTVDPARHFTADGARPGDRLYLTKALGTGVILAAARREAATAEHRSEVIASMRQLDRVAATVALREGAAACIAIGGRGLLGHAAQLAATSACGVELAMTAVPFLSGALEYAELGFIPAITARNRAAYARQATAAELPPLRRSVEDLLHDPQTSGGLLLSVPAARTGTLQAAFARARAPLWPIGEVVAGSGIRLRP